MTEIAKRTEAAPSWRLCRACGLADGSDYSCYCCMPQPSEPGQEERLGGSSGSAIAPPLAQTELERIYAYLKDLQLRDMDLYKEFAPVCERSLIVDLKRGLGSSTFKLVGRNTKDGRLHYYMPHGASIAKISDVQRELHRMCAQLGYRLLETQRVERTRRRVVAVDLDSDDFMWFRHIQKFFVFFQTQPAA